MRASDIRERTDQELTELEGQLRNDLWKARFDNFSNQLDDTAKIRKLRRDLARVKTVMTQRAQQQAKG